MWNNQGKVKVKTGNFEEFVRSIWMTCKTHEMCDYENMNHIEDQFRGTLSDGTPCSTFFVFINGTYYKSQQNSRLAPKALYGVELLLKGRFDNVPDIVRDCGTLYEDMVLEAREIISNKYSGYYYYLNKDENLKISGVFPIRCDYI